MGSYRFKIILAGDEAVGKTSTIMRFVHGTYSEMYKPTLGFQISVKVLNYTTPQNEDRTVVFSIWDIAGQGQFASVRKGYYAGTDGILLLFDLTRRKTFEDAKFWADEIRGVTPGAPIVLVGNKADLPSQAVLPQELTYLSNECKFASYVITSAATGRGVEEMFRRMADVIIDKISRPAAAAKSEEIITITRASVAAPPPTAAPAPPPIAAPAPPPAPVTFPEKVVPPEIQAQFEAAAAEYQSPVPRHPPIIPQIQIKMPAQRSVPPAPPVAVAPVITPPAPVSSPVEVHPVVVPVVVPITTEIPVVTPAPSDQLIIEESRSAAPAPERLPECIEPTISPPVTSSVPQEPGETPSSPKPREESLWKKLKQRLFRQK